MPASASGSSSSDVSSTGSTRPRVRIARQSALPSAPGIGRFAGRVHLGHDERVGIREHLRELVEQVARARVAVRLEDQHDATSRPALAHGLDGGRDLGRVMAVVVHERDACRRRCRRRRATAGDARCPGIRPARAGWRASSISSSVATVITASAFSTLWRPGRFNVTGSGGAPPGRSTVNFDWPASRSTSTARTSADSSKP